MCTFVGLLLLGLLATTSARMTPRTPIAAARAPPPLLMARWQPSDMAAIRQPLPPEVEGLLSDDTPRDGVERLWGVMVKCYATEEDAITAAERNTGTILPYLNRPGNIEGVFAYLVDSLGLEEAQDVVKKNPGVLACDPRIVAQTNPDDIVSAANNVDFIESLPIPLALRNNLDKVVFLLGAALVAKRFSDCAGASCGSGGGA